MRILSLKIEGYKMFNPSPVIQLGKELHLFIGVNGSGKSSIIEAIAYIFLNIKHYCIGNGSIEKHLNFTIEYTFTKREILEETTTTQNSIATIHHVILNSTKESGMDYTMLVDGKVVATKIDMYSFLPDNLIFYYSGFCENLEVAILNDEYETAQRLYNLKNQDDLSNVFQQFSKSFLYVKKEHFPLLFILNYIDNETKLPLIGKEFSIYNISFSFHKPRDFRNEDFSNFYNIQGFLKSFLLNLIQHSQPMEEIKLGRKHLGFNLTIEYHRGILDAIENLPNLTESMRFENTRYFAFQLINLLFKIGILKEINVSIRDSNGHIFSINDLSEGEQQLVTVEAINKILTKDNTILFFDEPDAFLHPQRQRDILPHLIEQFKSRFSEESSQLIITSHSPFVAQSIPLDQILVFDTEGESPTVPNKTLLSYSAITKGIFNLDSIYSTSIEEKLDLFRVFREKILSGQKYSQGDFIKTVKELVGEGEEMEVVIARELKQLERITNTKFDV